MESRAFKPVIDFRQKPPYIRNRFGWFGALVPVFSATPVAAAKSPVFSLFSPGSGLPAECKNQKPF